MGGLTTYTPTFLAIKAIYKLASRTALFSVMMKFSSEDMLRQNVFSSIHLSTELQRGQASVTYPSCSFCGGTVSGKKPSSARKVATCQLSLYTNPSESFIVWFKKPDEPKGMLWLRSCHVRRGSTVDGSSPVELISKGCRGRCSYTLRFVQQTSTEEWYRLLRQESRRNADYDDPADMSEEEESPLDRLLADLQDDGECSLLQDRKDRRESQGSSPPSSGRSSPKKPSAKTKNRPFRIQISTTFGRKTSVPVTTASSYVECPISPDSTTDAVSRWSWPVKA